MALRQVGTERIHLCSRRPAEDIADRFECRSGPLAPVSGATLVISTLPGEEGLAQAAMDGWIDASGRPCVYDLAYGGLGRPSPLVRQARAAGLVATDGLGMLVEQAALALHRWTGNDLEAVRSAMKASVGLPSSNDPFDSDSGAD